MELFLDIDQWIAQRLYQHAGKTGLPPEACAVIALREFFHLVDYLEDRQRRAAVPDQHRALEFVSSD